MGKLEEFSIHLDNPLGVYKAGQNMTGNVVVKVKKPMETRGVRLLFHGAAKVSWTERHGEDAEKHSATETYFDFDIVLFGKASGQSGDNHYHPAGRHVYPFQFTLPIDLPSSFKTSTGKVKYSVQGTIDRPWMFDHHFKKVFTVLGVLDLNTLPDCMSPMQAHKSKTLGFWCCKSGPISAVLQTDRTGYVPGEYITLRGEVDNKSNRTMSFSEVSLIMKTDYYTDTGSKSKSQTLSAIRSGEIPPGETEIWTGQRIQIPPTPPSSLGLCSVMETSYCIMMVIGPSGSIFDIEIPLEIIVGTVPLQYMQGMFPSAAAAAAPAPPRVQPFAAPSEPLSDDAADPLPFRWRGIEHAW